MRSSKRFWPSTTRLGGTIAVVALALASMLGGCSAAATPSPTAAGPAAAPVISGAWVRPPTGPGLPAAGYMTISNPGGQADSLTGVSSSVATSVEMHETTMMSGMTGMQPISRLDVPAGGSVELKPGGYHLMLMGVTGSLTIGSTVDLVLTFEKAGKVTVKAEVKNG